MTSGCRRGGRCDHPLSKGSVRAAATPWGPDLASGSVSLSTQPNDLEGTLGKRTPTAGLIASLVSLALCGCLLVACGSSPSAAQQVCSDRANLKSSVSTVVDDLSAGNFSKAKDDLPAVKDAFNALKDSAQNLTSEQSQALKPQIDNLKSTVTNLENSKSRSEVRSGLVTLRSQVQSISNEIGSTLNCG